MGAIRLSAASVTALLFMASPALAQLDKHDTETLSESAEALRDIRNASDAGIPNVIWDKAQCVVVIPELKKASFIVGAEGGRGVLSCRRGQGWTSPVFMEIAKGSFGLQAGAQKTQLILMIMNRKGLDTLLSNKVTLGGDASIAAGPIGRAGSVATDAQLNTEMLSYSRSKGLFAGIDLSGGTLKPDKDANAHAYGSVSARDVANGTARVTVPPEAQGFMTALGRDERGTTGR